MNSLLIHSKVPEGPVELEPDAQGSQPPPEALARRCGEEGVWSAVSFPTEAGGPQITPCGPPSPLAAPGCSEVN